MPLTTAVVVLKPLFAANVPAGRVTSRVPPVVWVSAPTVRASGLAVALAVRVIRFAPAETLRPAKVCVLMVLALPTRARVEPLEIASAEVAGMMLVEAGTAE